MIDKLLEKEREIFISGNWESPRWFRKGKRQSVRLHRHSVTD